MLRRSLFSVKTVAGAPRNLSASALSRCTVSTRAAAATSGSTPASSSSSTSSSSSNSSGLPTSTNTTGRYTDAEIRAVVRALEDDPELAVRVVNTMSPAARRQLVVAGSAFEWFGGQGAAKTEVTAADLDKDAIISSKDFDVWFEKALERRADAHKAAEQKGSGKQDSASSSSSSGASATAAATGLTMGCLIMIGLEAGLPFVGFGFLDNAVMILSGDAIDRTMGAFIGCSVLASAAMGNVVSGMLGMQIHGSIERLVHFLHLPVPALSEEQRKSRKVFMAGHMGGTIGIAIGLGLGMMPLMFISDHGEQRSFEELDTNKDQIVDEKELQQALRSAGIEHTISQDVAHSLMLKYGATVTKSGSMGLTTAQFHKLCVDLKAQGPVALTAMKMVAEA